MNTSTAIILVAIAGGAIYLVLRNQQQQQAAVAAAAAAPPMPAAAPSGGGVGGLAQRLVKQWEGDPLGTKNAAALVHGAEGVARNAASEVTGLVHSITSFF